MSALRVRMVAIDSSLLPMPDWLSDRLRHEEIEFSYQECATDEELASFAGAADVVWLMGGSRLLTDQNLHLLSRCRAILRTGSGTDNIPIAEATRRDILVVNTPQAICDSVADHAIGLLFAVMRRIAIHDRLVRQGTWDRAAAWPQWHIQGQTLGLVGFGMIGQSVARKLRGFELSVLAHDPHVDVKTFAEHGVQAAALEPLLSKSDFVSIHCPLMPATQRLIGAAELRRMKASAILINTARGPIVDEAALVQALTEGRIAAAGLDVLEREPPDADNPLMRLDNVVLTPHIGGYSDRCRENSWRWSVEALADLARGRRPRSVVNPEVHSRT